MGQHTDAERKQWFKLVSEFEESGLSRAKFCKQKSISLNTFTYYRSLRLKQEKPVKEFKSPFLELSLPSAPLESFRLSFPNGVNLTLPQQFNDRQLVKLIEVIRTC